MSKRNFGKSVIQGLVSSYGPAARAYNQQQLLGLKQQEEELKRQEEELKRQQENAIHQNDLNIIQSLVGKNAIPGSDNQQPTDFTGQGLSDKGSIRLNRILDIRNKLNPKTKYREYQGNLYPVDSQGNIDLSNPAAVKSVQPKKIATISGINDQGYKTSEIYYDDGTSKTLTSDLKQPYKEPISSKPLFQVSDNQFNDKLKGWVQKAGVISTYRSLYQNPENSAALNTSYEEKINTMNYYNEQEIYNQLDPVSLKFVNKFYTDVIKKNPGLDQKSLQDLFTEALFNAQLNDQLSSDPAKASKQVRALGLWAKFKFGYVGNPKNKTVKPKQPVESNNKQNSSSDPLGIL